MTHPPEPFGLTPDGEQATLHTLANEHLRVRISDYGGRMVSIEAPDRNGKLGHVLLGFSQTADYAKAGGAFGALLGRTANRISGGRFTLDGQTYQLARNEGENTLHGGPLGFDKLLWKVNSAHASPAELALSLISPEGEQGFPGELSVRAFYTLQESELTLTLEAQTTKPTVVNLSAHPYFNLAGAEASDVLSHRLVVAADSFLPADAQQLPTGEIASVAGTPFDFRDSTMIGARIRKADEQLLFGKGYDVCYVLPESDSSSVRFAAQASEPITGRVLEVHTTQPSMQLYTGNKLDGSVAGHGGVIYRQSAGFALEPQGFPDAPNHPNFPSTILRPGQHYRQVIVYRFSTR
ncbi:MAG: galactose mutarotase [Acetobacteraceae bacterium]|nr:galactose mutarotase [Acetobacteraceae bacterium]